jgi:hypothetical protein
MRTHIGVVGLVVGAIAIAGCSGGPAATTAVIAPSASVPPATTPAVTSPPGTTTPTQAGPRDVPSEGSVPAGTYTLDRELGMTIDIPAGWDSCCGGAILKNDFAGLLVFTQMNDITVYADACKWETGGQSEPKGAEAIAQALSAQKHHQASKPSEVTVAGVAGWVVRVQVPLDEPATVDADNNSTFTDCDQGKVTSFGTPTDALSRYHQAPGQIDEYYVIQVDGTPVIFDVVSGPDTPAADLAELEAMLASVQIG